MLLGELRQYALQFDEVRLLNRQVRVGDRWVAAARKRLVWPMIQFVIKPP